ncbi:MAG: hypothetical protein QXN71_02975 [Candidatus Aenigmatarchaeota archaeon]
MGGAPNYSKGRQMMRKISEGRAKAFAQNIIIKDGKGRYPDCLKILPYNWCPNQNEISNDSKNLPETCKTCQEFLKSRFYLQHFAQKIHKDMLKRISEQGLPTSIEIK